MNLPHLWICRSRPWRWFVESRLLPCALAGTDLGTHALELGPGPDVTTDLLRQRTA
ncbi:MAG: hypothetical protein AVDCRST_MAG28-3561 [uncultured Rubrobacteraceae bacterium]|uniref:Uncharacterized protein n=1 Tax=uncultured Rubrobacteraceae bacterium TaxID=349277 RepID=A0A6J4R683_9ACTN|nr:MAG: hypothetical protein AVDCRST_MAG28-3561 [uncultured Rubrobacteraceae bacterium]